MARNAKAGREPAPGLGLTGGRNQVVEPKNKLGVVTEPGDLLQSTGNDGRMVGDPGLMTKGINVRAAKNAKPGGTPGLKGTPTETGRPSGKVKY